MSEDTLQLQPIVVSTAFTAEELVDGFGAYASEEIERFGKDLAESASTDDLVSLVAGLAVREHPDTGARGHGEAPVARASSRRR